MPAKRTTGASESTLLYRVLTLSLDEPWLNGAAMNLLRKTCYVFAGWNILIVR
jgi:hypothetical protein